MVRTLSLDFSPAFADIRNPSHVQSFSLVSVLNPAFASTLSLVLTLIIRFLRLLPVLLIIYTSSVHAYAGTVLPRIIDVQVVLAMCVILLLHVVAATLAGDVRQGVFVQEVVDVGVVGHIHVNKLSATQVFRFVFLAPSPTDAANSNTNVLFLIVNLDKARERLVNSLDPVPRWTRADTGSQ